ncbi:MAG: EAL domain-containing protein [Butyrivibrio sp.]|nr:EAL domain-containing protein [Butyrivibrio sp.]
MEQKQSKSLKEVDTTLINPSMIAKYFPEVFDAFSHTVDGKYVYICYIPEDFSIWSKEAVEYFGLPSIYMHEAGKIWTEHIAPEDRERYVTEINELMSGKISLHNMIYRAKNKHGQYVTISCKGTIIRDEEGNPLYFAGTMVNYALDDVIDPVTELYTHARLRIKMENFAKDNTPYMVLFFAIQRFANINTTYGYEFGNKILKHVSEIMVTKKEGGEVFRIEGTKYAYLIREEFMSENKVIDKFYNLKKYLKNLTIEDTSIELDICGSYMKVNDFSIDTDTLYNSAIFSLSKAKKDNMQNLLLVDDSFFKGNMEKIAILGKVRKSIKYDFRGFFMVYQPIVDAYTEEVVGVEALLRWKDSDNNLVMPAYFIDWLEQDPLFYELGNWILKTAMSDMLPIIKKYPKITLSVNLAYTQLQRIEFNSSLVDIIKELEYPPQNLKLELTERCKILDLQMLINYIAFFKSIGVQTALDDFGTGYSALNFMVDLPVNQIKIDKTFIDNIKEKPAWQSLLKAITVCAHELNKQICIEGIETLELADFLRENFKVTSYQGYFFSKPIVIEDLISFINSRNGER